MTSKADAACRNITGQSMSVVLPVGLLGAVAIAIVGFFWQSIAIGKSQGKFEGDITARVIVLEENDKRIDTKLDRLQDSISGFERNIHRDIGEIKGALGIGGD